MNVELQAHMVLVLQSELRQFRGRKISPELVREIKAVAWRALLDDEVCGQIFAGVSRKEGEAAMERLLVEAFPGSMMQ